jgi:two-component system, chemotaxis family, protein-glutamate methylesterase/glutaminase
VNAVAGKSIRVLVVEDSCVVAEFLAALLNADPGIEVVGTVSDGSAALAAAMRTKPHVITMDIHMPHMNGYDATRHIMESWPTPIVVVSGTYKMDEVAMNFQALEAGAVAVIARPAGVGHPNHAHSAQELIDTVKLMSEVKVVKRWHRSKPAAPISSTGVLRAMLPPRTPVQIVAIGASTGGPIVLQTILAGLPKDFPVPILIVQHMTPGFTKGFVEWLGYSTGFPIHVATAGESLLAGHAYMAPDDFQMGVGHDHRILLSKDERENGMCPSVSFLFRSVAKVFGRTAVGVILTGMGVDGVDELLCLKNTGAITIAQDEETSVVHGMPGQAIKVGAALHVLPPEGIAKALITLLDQP